MSDLNKEKLLDKYPIPVTIDGTKKILEQMENCICKINNKKGKGTGFFCYIPFGNIPVMITNNHVIDEELIKENNSILVSINDDKKKIIIQLDNDRKIYTNKNEDITIIEIKKEKKEIKEFLNIDENILDNNINIYNENIYILQYPKCLEKQKAAVSYGIIKEINQNEIIHLCCTESGSSGSPILNISNNKVIGIHKEKSILFNFNIGVLLKEAINEFINNINLIEKNNLKNEISNNINKKNINKKNINKKNIIKKNEITLLLKIKKEDVSNKIYFLDNSDGEYFIDGKFIKYRHDNLKELTESNVDLF